MKGKKEKQRLSTSTKSRNSKDVQHGISPQDSKNVACF